MAELEAEFEKSRSEIATYLREFADKLDSDGSLRSETDVRTQGHEETGARTQEHGETGTRTPERDETGTRSQERSEVGTTDESVGDSSVQSSETTSTEKVTMLVGNESATMNPPETLSFSVAVDSDSSLMDAGSEESVSFVLRWASEEVETDDELSVH